MFAWSTGESKYVKKKANSETRKLLAVTMKIKSYTNKKNREFVTSVHIHTQRIWYLGSSRTKFQQIKKTASRVESKKETIGKNTHF